MRVANFQNVFQHDADQGKLKELREAVVADVYTLLRKPVVFDKLNASSLSAYELAQMRERYRRLLHYGAFTLPAERAIANELIWKWTEATGKYVGCQFWSLKAKEVFDLEVAKCDRTTLIGTLGRELSNRGRPKNVRLTHEHVYPIKDMKQWLQAQKELDQEGVRIHFERQCVGCVVLESEHDRTSGDHTNPWLRYKAAGITLALNPAWPDVQRVLIEEAGLLRTP